MSMHDEAIPNLAPTGKEKLIEEAAKALLWTTRGTEEPEVDWPADTQDAKRMAEVVLAVFERALLDAWKAGAEQAWEQSGMNDEYIQPWNRPDWDEEAAQWYRDAGFLLPEAPSDPISPPDDTEADRDISGAETLAEALFSISEKYDTPLTNNYPRWQDGRYLRHVGDFIMDVNASVARFAPKPQGEASDPTGDETRSKS